MAHDSRCGGERPPCIGHRLPRRGALLVLLAAIGLAACNTSKLSQNSGPTPTTEADPPRADERVVVLPETGDDEQVGMDCVRKAVAHRSSIPAGEFRAALYPRFEPDSLPKSEAELADLLDPGSVREKIASLGARYIVVVSGETHVGRGQVGALAEAVILITSPKSSSLSFQVWDLASVKSLGSGSASAPGDVGGGEVLVFIPIVIWASTEAATCEEITRRLSAIFEPGHERRPDPSPQRMPE